MEKLEAATLLKQLTDYVILAVNAKKHLSSCRHRNTLLL